MGVPLILVEAAFSRQQADVGRRTSGGSFQKKIPISRAQGAREMGHPASAGESIDAMDTSMKTKELQPGCG